MRSSAHLNQSETSPMFNRLTQSIREAKQGRASAEQWLASIRALAQKGVKQAEATDIRLDEWLTMRGSDVVTREELLDHIVRVTPTVKELIASDPKYAGYVIQGGEYEEIYYVLASEKDRKSDRLEEVEHEMDLMSLDASAGLENDDIEVVYEKITKLERERAYLMESVKTAYDFTNHHWGADVKLKNLFAHARVSTFPDGTYFIQEIQSDWAQNGRRQDWPPAYPKAPLVTNTEAWAGMVLRRQLQRAAMRPDVKRIAWMTETMRNGWEQDLDKEARNAANAKAYTDWVKAKSDLFLEGKTMPEAPEARKALTDEARRYGEFSAREHGLVMPGDLLNEFYLRMLPKLADKVLAGTGASFKMTDMQLGARSVKVPAVEITDAVRAKLTAKQSVYSFALTHHQAADESDERFQRALANARHMLGDLAQVRLLKKVYDVASGNSASGRTVDRLIQVSLAAKKPEEVMDHECMHFALDNLLDTRERKILEASFAIGSPLHRRVCELALLDNEPRLARQCQNDPHEAIAQGFAYWSSGRLQIDDHPPARGLFSRIAQAVSVVGEWVRKVVLQEELHTVSEVFSHLAHGALAEREQVARSESQVRPGIRASA